MARNIALFTVAFSTTKRGDEFKRTPIQRVLRLPNSSGFMFNFQRGKTTTDGTDLLITMPYQEVSLATCPKRAVEQMGHDQRVLVPTVNGRGRQSTSERVGSNNTTNGRLAQAALSSGKRKPRFLHVHSLR